MVAKDREMTVLESLLDGINAPFTRRFHYDEYFDRNNIKVVRGIHSREDRINFLLPGNPECSEKDWWLMYAVNALNVADADSIIRYLARVKDQHKELYFTTDNARIITRRLNMLSKMGFFSKYLYVVGTNTDIDDAQQAYDIKKQRAEEEFALQTEISKPTISVDDEYFDDESADEVELVTYSTGDYSKYLAMRKSDNYIRGKNKYAVLNDNGNKTPIYFGKGSSLVTLYGIEDETLRNLKDRFGANIPFNKGNTLVKLASEQMGDAAVGYIASKFCALPTFHNFKSGRIQCRNGLFMVPIEMEFRVRGKDGNEFPYNCGIFKSFYNRATGRTLPSHDKGRVYDTISNIKNYIGLKGITKKTHDAFVIVVVNDTEDLRFFADALMRTTAVNRAEINRIFFTGEGIVRSDIGTDRVIRIVFDGEDREHYALEPIQLPIIR